MSLQLAYSMDGATESDRLSLICKGICIWKLKSLHCAEVSRLPVTGIGLFEYTSSFKDKLVAELSKN